MHSDSLELANDAVLKVMLVHRQYRAKQITGVYTISQLLLSQLLLIKTILATTEFTY